MNPTSAVFVLPGKGEAEWVYSEIVVCVAGDGQSIVCAHKNAVRVFSMGEEGMDPACADLSGHVAKAIGYQVDSAYDFVPVAVCGRRVAIFYSVGEYEYEEDDEDEDVGSPFIQLLTVW